MRDAISSEGAIVITGASGGVGRAIARELAGPGRKIALIARGMPGLTAAQKEVESAGGQALAVPADVSDPRAVEAAAERVERELGPIDVWINNAMVTVFAPVSEVTSEEYRRVTAVTYLGVVYGTQAALRRMKARGHGHIIQIGSALSYRAIPLQSAYCAAKYAVRGFADALHAELAHDRSRVKLSMVQLPGLNTPQFSWGRAKMRNKPKPVPPIFQPEVAAKAIISVIGTNRRELYVGGPTVLTIWASKYVSRFLDWYLARKAFEGQMRDESMDPERPDNLFAPVERDFGAHGVFDDEAKWWSGQQWLHHHRYLLSAVGIAFGITVVILLSA